MANLYWQDSGSQAWEDVLNWWTDAAATTQAANAPWVNGVDSTYLAYDLTSASGATNAPIIGGSYSAKNIGTGVSGICDIISIILDFDSNIYGGTFSGDNFTNNYSYITSGTFSGNNFNNSGTVDGGAFSGSGFINNNAINGGTFSGSGFSNGNAIYDGTFTGDDFINSDYIYGGTFSGDDFINSDSIYGGTFTGNGFSNGGNGAINGGTFLPDAITVTTSGGNTLLSINGGPTFGYPTPASGGSDQTIARLLNLPWFINL
jgi:hypothetical protein